MTNAILLILLGVAQAIASDVAMMRNRPWIGLTYTVSGLLASCAGCVLLISEWLQ